MEVSVVQTIITTVTSLVTAFAGHITTWLQTIFATGNEALVVCFCLPLIGAGITLLARMMGRRA